ncbi:MAG: hypothetical protein AAGN35_27875 [Bacteroidota bacterium]
MNKFFSFFLFLLMVGGVQPVTAQSAALSVEKTTEQPVKFTVVDANSGATLVFYFEGNLLSDAGGELVATFAQDARTEVFAQIEQLRNSAQVTQFDLNEVDNRLSIAMSGKDATQLFESLTASLTSAAVE